MLGLKHVIRITGAVVLVVGCRQTSATSELTDSTAGASFISPMCQEGFCGGETDPNPTAPGYYIASSVTPDACLYGGHTDADVDQLSDFCEKNLASAFAPQLHYYQYDETGREPHWVARRIAEEGVRLGYLLSYYRDAGSSSPGCSLPFHPPSCDGHNGDSEAIFLDLYYDYGTEHWVLGAARFSQHGSLKTYDGDGCTATSFGCVYLQYPDRPQGYPRAWVSEGKHANYANLQDCNHGGFGAADTCDQVNIFARVVAGVASNLGSRSYHSTGQDCIESSNPSYLYYGSGRTECYWTVKPFQGWIPDSVGGANSSPYSEILEDMGF